MPSRNSFYRLVSILFCLASLTISGETLAKAQTCQGPAECCPSDLSDTPTEKAVVQLGVLLVGLYAVDEKAGSWSADFYLSESWRPAARFSPETEIANEVQRLSEQFDTTELSNGKCTRTRRIRSVLQNSFNLRTFPFDRQVLLLEFSDAWFTARDVVYARNPTVSALDSDAQEQLTSWKVEGGLTYSRFEKVLPEATGAAPYEYARFSLPVRRHITFHLTKFFLPLLVIVAVAFGLFWIDPTDISTRVSIGVTCLLAAIAFQLADASSLGQVEYLTLADRVYAICYACLALALLMAIFQNALIRRGRADAAKRWDVRSRYGFPLSLTVAIVIAFVRAFTQVG